MIIDEALLFFNKVAGDFSRYMIECAITTKKQQTRVAQLENSTFEVDRVDKEPEELDNLAKMEQSFDKRPKKQPTQGEKAVA